MPVEYRNTESVEIRINYRDGSWKKVDVPGPWVVRLAVNNPAASPSERTLHLEMEIDNPGYTVTNYDPPYLAEMREAIDRLTELMARKAGPGEFQAFLKTLSP